MWTSEVRAGVGDEYGHKLEIGSRTIPESFATGSGMVLESFWNGSVALQEDYGRTTGGLR